MTALTAAEARIALLEAELETYKMYKSERDSLERAYDQATKDRNHWHDKWEATDRELGKATYQSERELAYWRHQGLLYRARVEAVKALCDEMESGPRSTHSISHAFAHDVRKAINEAEPLNSGEVLIGGIEEKPRERAGKEVSPYELQVGDVVDVWHGDEPHEPYYPAATIEPASPLIADQFDFEGLERSFPRFQFRLLKRPDKRPDNPWFGTVYEDAPYLAGTWRGTPVRPQSIRAGDLYDIHTAHGSRITGVVAARNGVRNPQSGDHYRLITRKA